MLRENRLKSAFGGFKFETAWVVEKISIPQAFKSQTQNLNTKKREYFEKCRKAFSDFSRFSDRYTFTHIPTLITYS